MKDEIIDRKFKFLAVNPVNGNIYTEKNAFVMCAKDAAVLAGLGGYLVRCKELQANPEHIESIICLMTRVQDFQEEQGARVPDTIGQEIERCVHGIGLDDE